MARRRQVYLAAAVLTSLIGIPACAALNNNNNPAQNPAANTGTGNGTTTTQPVEFWGSVLVQLQLPERQVQAVADVIDKIDLSVTGSKIANPISATITKAQITGGSATATLTQIPPGDATLAAYVKDSAGNVIASSDTALTIVAGKEAKANLEVTVPTFGSISTSIAITGSGAASGSTVVPDEAFPAVSGNYGVLQANSKYVGATTCKTCHPTIFNTFKATAHWNPREATGNRPGTDIENFSGFMDKKSGTSAYLANNSCRSCHVVGDGSAWNPTTRKVDQSSIFLADGTTVAGFDFSQAWNSDYNKKFVGIQCESCHGPGGNHVAATNTTDRKNAIVKTPNYQKTCAACHNKNPRQEWNGASDTDVNFGGGQTYAAHPQILIYGQGGGYNYGQTIPKSAHVARIGNGCISCHASGATPTNHTLYMKERGEAAMNTCTKCHGSNFNEANVTAYQAQTKLAVDGLKKMLIEYRKAFCQEVAATTSASPTLNSTASADIADITKFCTQWDDSPDIVKNAGVASHSNAVRVISANSTTWSPHHTAYNRAYWNKSLVEKDNAWGVHSPVYVQSLIRLSYNDLLKDLPSSASYTVLGLKK